VTGTNLALRLHRAVVEPVPFGCAQAKLGAKPNGCGRLDGSETIGRVELDSLKKRQRSVS
jgi:hypothetical protein